MTMLWTSLGLGAAAAGAGYIAYVIDVRRARDTYEALSEEEKAKEEQ